MARSRGHTTLELVKFILLSNIHANMLCQNLMRLGKDLHTWPQPLESFSKLVKCQGSIVEEK